MTTKTDVDLEALLNDTLKCVGGHKGCTVDATHHLVHCEPAIPVCMIYVTRHLPFAVEKGLVCAGCGRKIRVCWRAIPT